MGNENIQEMQTIDYEKEDWSPSSHQNGNSYRDLLVIDLERVPNRRESRWQVKNPKSRQNKEVEFIPRIEIYDEAA